MKTLLSLLFLLLLPVCASAQTVYHVYYLGGQSNMDGYGYIKDLPEAINTPVAGVPIFHGNMGEDGAEVDGKGLWATLRPGHGVGFHTDGTQNFYSERFGMELTFVRHLLALRPNENIALIKYSKGGTSIHQEAAGQFGAWEPDYNTGNGVNQYDHFLATMRHALAATDIDGDGQRDVLIPAGILWMQGESDAVFSEEIARAYEANLKRLMDLIRAALHTDDLPVVIGRISDSGRDADGQVWTHGAVVRQAQADFVDKDGYAALVTSTDAYGYSDPWHYDSAGYLDLGEQFAEAIHRLRSPR